MKFESIWETYERELSSFVLSRVYDKEIQKEVMQDIALKIFTSLHLQKEHLRGWLYTIAKNVITDYYRKQNKPLPEPEEAYDEQEHILQECLEPLLNTLKTEEKEILTLTQLKQYSLKEVATQKNLPLNTVKSQLFRAKKSLAGKFFSCCEYGRDAQGNVVDYSSCSGEC